MEVIRRHICTKVDFPANHVCLLEDNASTDQHENHEPVNRCKQDTAQGYWHECYTNAPKFSGQGPIKVDYYLYQYQYFFLTLILDTKDQSRFQAPVGAQFGDYILPEQEHRSRRPGTQALLRWAEQWSSGVGPVNLRYDQR